MSTELDQIIERAHDKYWDKGFSSLTERARVVYSVHLVEFEVSNGGFDQYFSNTSDWDLISTAIHAFEIIRASARKTLLERAIITAMAGKTVEDFIDPRMGIHIADEEFI